MAWPDTTSIKDAIARRLEGVATYSAGSTLVQALVDDAYNVSNQRIGQYAQLVSQSGTTVPDVWANWMVALGSYYYATARRIERAPVFKAEADDYRLNFAGALQRTAIDASSTTHGTPLTITQVRRACLSRCFRLDPPLMASIDDVDASALDAAHDIWTRKDWSWKKRLAKFVVTNETTITITEKETATAVIPDRFVSRFLSHNEAGTEESVTWMDADEATVLRARADDDAQPQRFRVDRSATGAWKWTFWPQPDVAYTFYGYVVIAVPALTTPAEFDAATQLMPARLQHVLRDMAYAKLLRVMGRKEARLLDDIDDRLDRMEMESDDAGAADNTPTVRDVYNDLGFVGPMGGGYNFVGGGM